MSSLVEKIEIAIAIMVVIDIFFLIPLLLNFWSEDAFSKYKNKKKIYLWTVGITNLVGLLIGIYLAFFFE
ncbi:hypothetical protein CIG75_04815 [Tumebacillus algifaecis]|uniref:Uncharacterized protein n=1 Tax=Tumebacillus algifaecis TaxID=1214604 RepID=A0A223CYG1_9BACL|nr:hypothetical protein CIG75_04815 [Tumebacillus algifaecis]